MNRHDLAGRRITVTAPGSLKGQTGHIVTVLTNGSLLVRLDDVARSKVWTLASTDVHIEGDEVEPK